MEKIKIYYHADGDAVSDFEAEPLAKRMFSKEHALLNIRKTAFYTSSGIFITAIRALINEGVIGKNEVEFIWETDEDGH